VLISGLLIPVLMQSPANGEALPVYAAVGGSLNWTDGTAETESRSQPFPPSEVFLNGLPFDDESSGWSIDVGYRFTEFFAVELGYDDLGRFSGETPVAATAPLFTPAPTDLFYVPPAPFIGVVVAGPPPPQPELEARAFNLAARFGIDITERFRAIWHLGLARAEFEAGGSTTFLVAPATISEPFEEVSVPFANPGNETGYFFGFGIGWKLGDHFDAELSYSRRDLEVLKFDSIGLRLVVRP
jgi:hypothetical protein